MLNARAIYRLLIDDEQPVPSPPEDPNQLGLDFNDDDLDPTSEIMRYADTPFQIPGSGPTDLYARLEHKLDGKPRKKVANNTYIIRHPDRLAVRLHQTDVVTAFPDGRVVVNSGGWRPGGGKQDYGWRSEPGTTTMDRINSWTPSGWKIYKKDHVWYWFNYAANGHHWDSDTLLPYSDKDTIMPNGYLKAQERPIYLKRRRKRTS
jgi:hypothetical protein